MAVMPQQIGDLDATAVNSAILRVGDRDLEWDCVTEREQTTIQRRLQSHRRSGVTDGYLDVRGSRQTLRIANGQSRCVVTVCGVRLGGVGSSGSGSVAEVPRVGQRSAFGV